MEREREKGRRRRPVPAATAYSHPVMGAMMLRWRGRWVDGGVWCRLQLRSASNADESGGGGSGVSSDKGLGAEEEEVGGCGGVEGKVFVDRVVGVEGVGGWKPG